MLAIQIELLTGRYHATPWGRHVNEGEVEWPPSPWRMLRALVATGFGKLGWTDVPADARALLTKLAEHAPVILLPPATAAHTRHFMPPFKGNKAKVLDAFVDVGRGAPLGVQWDVHLDPSELAVLDALLGGLSYLGRAEAWAEARRVEQMRDGLSRCAPSPSAPGPGYDRVALLAPIRADDYAAWRETQVAEELTSELERKRNAAEEKGKKPPARLSKKDTEKVSAAYPADLIDALRVDTAALQKDGWSQPPGSQWLSYWRDERALSPTPSLVNVTRRVGPLPDTAILAIASDTKNGERLPRFEDTVRRLEALHDALVAKSSDARGAAPSPSLIGKSDGVPIKGHQHASLIPLCLSRGPVPTIDHVLVHAPMGLDASAQHALRRVRPVYVKGGMRFFVTLVGLGSREELSMTVDALKPARLWTSSTPFVPPRHLKPRGKNTLHGQVLAELTSRQLEAPELIEIEIEIPGDIGGQAWKNLAELDEHARPSTRWRHFRRARLDADRQPPSRRGFGLRLTFAEPIRGPISLGYASHFGLGAFVPLLH